LIPARSPTTPEPPTTKALGLFGGTFDPIHLGHLRLATELAEAFHLDQVLFVPAGLPYHRGRLAHATNEQRLTMLKLATARDARFGVDERELKREGNTYTYDTLAEIRKERGPNAPLVFLMGTDTFAKIDTWHRWTELFDLAHFGVAIRAEDANWNTRGPGAFPTEIWPRITLNLRELLAAPAGNVMTFKMTPLAISSTAIRETAAAGGSIRYLTPDPVVEYIRTHQVYSSHHLEAPNAAQ
jgi:nicotinate-nucleotide adenylyltransferase